MSQLTGKEYTCHSLQIRIHMSQLTEVTTVYTVSQLTGNEYTSYNLQMKNTHVTAHRQRIHVSQLIGNEYTSYNLQIKNTCVTFYR